MRFHSKVLIVFLSLLLSNFAKASDSGFYLGGTLGYSFLNEDEPVVTTIPLPPGATVQGPTFDIDDEDIGWKILAGYNLNQYFGVEFGYVDLGEAELNSTTIATETFRNIITHHYNNHRKRFEHSRRNWF